MQPNDPVAIVAALMVVDFAHAKVRQSRSRGSGVLFMRCFGARIEKASKARAPWKTLEIQSCPASLRAFLLGKGARSLHKSSMLPLGSILEVARKMRQRHSAASSSEYSTQTAPNTFSPVHMLCPDIVGGCLGAYRRAEMTVADDSVQLPVGQLEKPFRFSISIVFHSGCPKNRVIEGDRNCRVVVAQHRAHCIRLILGFMQRRKEAMGILFEKFRPTLETLAAGHDVMRVVLVDLGENL